MAAVMLASQCLIHRRHSHVHIFHPFVHSFKQSNCSTETVSNFRKLVWLLIRPFVQFGIYQKLSVHGWDLRKCVNQQIFNRCYFVQVIPSISFPLVLSIESSDTFPNCPVFSYPAEQHSCCLQCPSFSCLSRESRVRWSWLWNVVKFTMVP